MTTSQRIAVKVTPRSGRDQVIGWSSSFHEELYVRVRAVPEGGKANKAVRDLLAKSLGVPKTSLSLVRGDTSHHKVFEVPLEQDAFDSWAQALPLAQG